MITTINANRCNGSLSECLSAHARFRKAKFSVPERHHGQKSSSCTCCGHLDVFMRLPADCSDDDGHASALGGSLLLLTD